MRGASITRHPAALSALVFAMFITSCATQQPQMAASLVMADAATANNVREVLAQAVGRTNIQLGPEDLATSTTISVLPLPLTNHDGRSLAMPTLFDIVVEGSQCLLVAREGGQRYPLTRSICVSAPKASSTTQ
jgi:hypothetical protein